MKFLISCAPGLETILGREVRDLGIEGEAEVGPGIMALEMEWDEAFKVMLESRIASRVMLLLREFAAHNEAMLYDQVRRVDWSGFAKVANTMAVFTHGRTDTFPLTFAALKIKDAVCDEYRKCGIDRPSVERQLPILRLEAFFNGGRCELSVDLCGIPLHRRGYRDESGEAPLRENRAAALLRFAGFDGSRAMIDPFCGSGTIVIEAALMLAKRAPGTLRGIDDFVLPVLFPEHAEAFRKRWQEAKSRMVHQKPTKPLIRAIDNSKKTLAQAKDNAKRAGVQDYISFEVGDARKLESPEAFIVTNPPYGLRLEKEDAAQELLSTFTRQLKHACAPCSLTLVIPPGPLTHAVGFKPEKKLVVKSGTQDLLFQQYEIRAGKFTRKAEA